MDVTRSHILFSGCPEPHINPKPDPWQGPCPHQRDLRYWQSDSLLTKKPQTASSHDTKSSRGFSLGPEPITDRTAKAFLGSLPYGKCQGWVSNLSLYGKHLLAVGNASLQVWVGINGILIRMKGFVFQLMGWAGINGILVGINEILVRIHGIWVGINRFWCWIKGFDAVLRDLCWN